jgi:DNA-binding IclR family transcriptional regulator
MRFIAIAPRSLTEIAELLEVHKSTALRLLQTLEEEGLARRLSDGKHAIGFGVIPLAQFAMDQIDIRSLAHQHLERLAEHAGHTVHLAQLIGDEVIYADKVDGRGTVAMGSRIGLPAELHTAAVAKIILAWLNGSQRERVLARVNYRQYTKTTKLTAAAYEHELEITKKRGWAEDDGEKEDYINCVALPIFDAAGRVTVGMSVTALRAVAPLKTLRANVPAFRQVSQQISRELGWNGDADGRA